MPGRVSQVNVLFISVQRSCGTQSCCHTGCTSNAWCPSMLHFMPHILCGSLFAIYSLMISCFVTCVALGPMLSSVDVAFQAGLPCTHVTITSLPWVWRQTASLSCTTLQSALGEVLGALERCFGRKDPADWLPVAECTLNGTCTYHETLSQN